MKIILILISVLLVNTVLGAEAGDSKSAIQDNSKLERLEDSVKEIRRDQLNYSIEKDLLKKVYSSNLETVNTIITIVLGVFAVLGFLGMRSISSLRDQFKTELETFQYQRRELDQKLSEVEGKQNEVDIRMNTVTEVTNHQDIRLKVLEIQEKASNLIVQNDPKRALEYIAVGLESAPNDIVLLSQKLQCYFKQGRLEDAVDVTERLIELDGESNKSHALNLVETYLLLERFESFDEAYLLYKRDIEKKKYLSLYLTPLKYYLSDDKDKFIEAINIIIDTLPAGKHKSTTWSYDEARLMMADKPDTIEKTILLKAFEVLNGKANKEDLENIMPGNEPEEHAESPVDDDS